MKAEEDTRGVPVIIPLHLNKMGAVELENRIVSAYGKDELEALLGTNDSNVLWTKNNEDIHQLLSIRLQLPAAKAEDIFNNSLPHAESTVKNQMPIASTETARRPAQHKENAAVDKTYPIGTEITPDFTGAVQVDVQANKLVTNFAKNINKKSGIKIGFAEYYQDGQKNNSYNGHWDPNTNTMYFNPDITAQDMLFGIVMHESTHPTESTEAYKKLSEYVLNRKYGGEDTAEYKNALAEKQRNYQAKIVNRVFTQQEARAELVAEQIAEILSYSDSKVRSIVDADYTFGQRVLDWIKETVHYWSVKFGGDVEAKRALNDFRTVERYFDDALRQAKNNVSRDGISKYSIYNVNGKTRVFVDADITKGKNAVDTPAGLKKFLLKQYKEIQYRRDNGEVGILYFDEQSAKEFSYSEYTKALRRVKKYDKYRMANNLDEIVNAQTNSRYEDPKHDRNDDIVGFYRANVEVQIDTRLYDVELLTGIDMNGREKFYDIVEMNLIRKDEAWPTLAEKISFNGRLASDSSNKSLTQSGTKSQEEIYGETDFGRAFRLAQEKKNAKNAKNNQNIFINAEKSSELQKILDDHYFVAGGKLKQAIDNAHAGDDE